MASFHLFSLSQDPTVATPQQRQNIVPQNLGSNKVADKPLNYPQGNGLLVVELTLEEQQMLNRLKKYVSTNEPSENFFDDYLDEAELLRYKAHEQEDQFNEQEEESASGSYSTSSTLPIYLRMTKCQRINYFERLNREYQIKMTPNWQNPNLKSNSDTFRSKTKFKPTIKFSDTVYELPFGKDDEPAEIDIEVQVETQIRFDAAAYQMDEENQEDDSNSQEIDEEYNQRQNYFEGIDEFDFEENMKNQIFSTTQKSESYSEENPKEETENFPLNHEPPFSQSPKIQQSIHMEELPFEEEEQLNVFKRDANRKFLSEVSTSSDSNSSDSSSSEWRQIDYNEQLESYFALFLNGRKIKPNAVPTESRASNIEK